MLRRPRVNGRLTGATAARYFLGYNEVGAIIEDLLRRPVSSGLAHGTSLPLKLHHTMAMRRADCAVLERQQEWHAAVAEGTSIRPDP